MPNRIETKRYVDPATFASVHASLGEIDEAVRFYQEALEDRSPDMVYALAAIRLNQQLGGNAEYREILERMHFPLPVT